MNKNIIIAVAVMLVAAMFFTACKTDKLLPPPSESTVESDEDRKDAEDKKPSEKHDQNQEQKTTEKDKKETTEKAEETTKKPEPPAPPQSQNGVKDLGVTKKGYRITQKNGITYVDGTMIANKTYPLPRNYNPGALTPECDAAYEEMKAAAKKQGLTLWLGSGFRSYDTQASIYNRYVGRDGKAEADRYSARPGHSEHQTGMAIDLNDISSAFANTPEGKWVAEHLWEYGFILRYKKETESITGYMYEPWHIRYVGKDLAKKVYDSGLCLEEYFGISSEYGAPQEGINPAPQQQTPPPQSNKPVAPPPPAPSKQDKEPTPNFG